MFGVEIRDAKITNWNYEEGWRQLIEAHTVVELKLFVGADQKKKYMQSHEELLKESSSR